MGANIYIMRLWLCMKLCIGFTYGAKLDWSADAIPAELRRRLTRLQQPHCEKGQAPNTTQDQANQATNGMATGALVAAVTGAAIDAAIKRPMNEQDFIRDKPHAGDPPIKVPPNVNAELAEYDNDLEAVWDEAEMLDVEMPDNATGHMFLAF
eukprot:Protomagalhaensia_sp_Gyna_25__5323@NODE_66_length_5710_cov_131_847117_g49_i0_p6_GENE_NODE_66_length_5710_cov_131_847117_g49_i0NODE_66_length_5710_cov_131_847117_g49_i0_p6_ORF_typecomplete_len152_score24_67Glyzipper_Omp/PF13488_6/0_026_NODE_66_length_5710_cov_131_847117_g49_i030413496